MVTTYIKCIAGCTNYNTKYL